MNKEAGIWIIAIIVLIGGGWYLYRHTEQAPRPAPLELNTFTDTTHGFVFSYPNIFELNTPDETHAWRENTDNPGQLLTLLTLPESYQPNSNFREARFTVGVSNDATTLASCLAEGEKVIFSDAGAGNFYETTSRRFQKNGACFAVEYTIHSTNIANYPPEQGINEFDKEKVRGELEMVAESFKFLP